MRARPSDRIAWISGLVLVVTGAAAVTLGSAGSTDDGPPDGGPTASTGALAAPGSTEGSAPKAMAPPAPPLPSLSFLPTPYDFVRPPAPSSAPPPTPTPTPTRGPAVASGPTGRLATRVVVPALGIDLPVMLQKTSYPPCDVAMYLRDFDQPGQGGPTYLYAHARSGMFLPLLSESKRNNGTAMLGMRVHVYTGDNLRFTYEITRVRRHARDFGPVLAAKGETVWLQTSEGPNASYPKLQVAGKLVGRSEVPFDEAHPLPRPRSC